MITIEDLKTAVFKGPVFVKCTTVDDTMPDVKVVRSVYGLVTDVNHTYDNRDCHYVDAYEAPCKVSIETTEIVDKKSGKQTVLLQKVHFNTLLVARNTRDILQFLDCLEFRKPPKDIVKQVSIDLKNQAVEAYSRVSTWCELMDEAPFSL